MGSDITRRKAEKAAMKAEARSTLDKCRVKAGLYCLAKGEALPIKIRILSMMADMAERGAIVCGQVDCTEHER